MRSLALGVQEPRSPSRSGLSRSLSPVRALARRASRVRARFFFSRDVLSVHFEPPTNDARTVAKQRTDPFATHGGAQCVRGGPERSALLHDLTHILTASAPRHTNTPTAPNTYRNGFLAFGSAPRPRLRAPSTRNQRRLGRAGGHGRQVRERVRMCQGSLTTR